MSSSNGSGSDGAGAATVAVLRIGIGRTFITAFFGTAALVVVAVVVVTGGGGSFQSGGCRRTADVQFPREIAKGVQLGNLVLGKGGGFVPALELVLDAGVDNEIAQNGMVVRNLQVPVLFPVRT